MYLSLEELSKFSFVAGPVGIAQGDKYFLLVVAET